MSDPIPHLASVPGCRVFDLDQAEFLQTQAGAGEAAGGIDHPERPLDGTTWQDSLSVFGDCREQEKVKTDLALSKEGADAAVVQCLEDGAFVHGSPRYGLGINRINSH